VNHLSHVGEREFGIVDMLDKWDQVLADLKQKRSDHRRLYGISTNGEATMFSRRNPPKRNRGSIKEGGAVASNSRRLKG